MNLLEDIYYDENYARLYISGDESIFSFRYDEGSLLFYNLAIRRPIKKIGDEVLSETFYDLETPYGYGGYLVNTDDILFIKRALEKYKEHCVKEKIIAEFIRFHPFNSFPSLHSPFLSFCSADRDVVIVDLMKSHDERWECYKSKLRTLLRKCESVLSFSELTDLKRFQIIYHETMNREDAADFYFFDDSYFKKMANFSNIRFYGVSSNEELISAGCFMFGKEIAHYHLSGNVTEQMKLNGNYLLLDRLFDIAKERNCKWFHLGGGKSNNTEDSLLFFKSKFSDITKTFFIGGMVFIPDIYEKYKQIWDNKHPGNQLKYFLKYRQV